MKPRIVRQLRMERRDQNVFPFGRDDPPVYLTHNLHPGPHILKERRPYKHPHERLFKALYLELLLEGVDLPPEPVSFDERVHQAQQGLPRPRRRRRRERPIPRGPLRPPVPLPGRSRACLAVTSHASPASPPPRDPPSPCRPSPLRDPCSPPRRPSHRGTGSLPLR